MRNPRLTWVLPSSSCQATRKMICRSGSQSLSTIFSSTNSGCLSSTGSKELTTSRTAWWNSGSPGFLSITSEQIPSTFESISVILFLLFGDSSHVHNSGDVGLPTDYVAPMSSQQLTQEPLP